MPWMLGGAASEYVLLAKQSKIPRGFRLEEDFLHASVANEIVRQYYVDTIGYGGYYTLAAAQQRMDQLCWRSQRIRNVMSFLRAVRQVGSVQALRNNFELHLMAAVSKLAAPIRLSGIMKGYCPNLE